jgi:hypothetical protein
MTSLSTNRKFERHRRQYFGCIQPENKRVVIITFDLYRRFFKINWDFKEVMLLADGRNNHWKTEFDNNANKLVCFSVNSMGDKTPYNMRCCKSWAEVLNSAANDDQTAVRAWITGR